MPNELNLVDVKDAIDKLQNDDSYNAIGKLNLAAWLGERAHFLVAEIEKLQQERSDLLAALEEVVNGVNDEWSHWFSEPLLTEEEREWLERAEKLVEQARTSIAELEERNEHE